MDQSRTKEMTADEARVPAAQLGAFVTRAFVAAGLPEAEAQTVARYMVEAASMPRRIFASSAKAHRWR